MGVERAVTRWYVQHRLLVDEIVVLEGKLALLAALPAEEAGSSSGPETTINVEALQQEWAGVQAKLRLLGPCPKPMMG